MKKIKEIKKSFVLLWTLVMALSVFTGCSTKTGTGQKTTENTPNVGNLKHEKSIELKYAECFNVDYFKDGYTLLTIEDTQKFLMVPENMEVPTGIDSDITPVKRPVTGLYAANTPSVSLINAIGALDSVEFTGTDVDDWYIDDVANAMKAGSLKFGGKYNTPDYESFMAAKCNLVIQSTMIESVPEVKSKFTELGIPVLVDQSGDESHPLGRIEWLKFYAALLGVDMSAANEAFDAQVAIVDELSKTESTGKTAAIFYISSKGNLYVRNTGDYVTKMLELAGGKYIYDELPNTGSNSTTMEMEKFYTEAKDADYIIYMYSLGGKPDTIKDLVDKNGLLADFKAVKEGNVWATCPEFFQISDVLGSMIGDIHTMLTTEDENITKLDYLNKLQ